MNLLNRTLLPLLALLACTGPALAQAAAGYNRIVDSADITYTPLSSGGWQITARAYVSNLTPNAVDLTGQLTIALNNTVVGSATQTLVIPGLNAAAPASCSSACAPSNCAICKTSSATNTCWCGMGAINASATVPALHPGDVITAFVTPAPGAAAEAIAGDDWGFAAVPPHVRWNRKLPADSLTYQPAPDGSGFVITGDISIQVTYGDSGNLGAVATVYSGTTVIGGGLGAGGTGGTCSPSNVISFGPGYPHNPLVGLWDCTPFCAGCTGYDINICNPPGISGSPWCMCQQMCAARTVPGHDWEVQVPPLNPDAFITIGLSPLPGSLSEIDTSDDAVTVQVRDITPCPADMGSQGGLPGRDHLLDNNDFVVFIEYFFTGDTRADLGVQGGTSGHDGHFDNNDFVVFIDQFFTGC